MGLDLHPGSHSAKQILQVPRPCGKCTFLLKIRKLRSKDPQQRHVRQRIRSNKCCNRRSTFLLHQKFFLFWRNASETHKKELCMHLCGCWHLKQVSHDHAAQGWSCERSSRKILPPALTGASMRPRLGAIRDTFVINVRMSALISVTHFGGVSYQLRVGNAYACAHV